MANEQIRTASPSTFFDNELARAIYDIREMVVRVEEGQKRTEKSIEKIESKVEKLEEKVDSTDSRATEALIRATEAQKDVESLRASNKWAWGTAITLLVGLATVIVTLL